MIRTPLPRTPVKRRRKTRRGRVVDRAMLAFIHEQPCLLALRNPDAHRCEGRLTAHHVRVGAAPKDDTRVVPLCWSAHLHDGSRTSIERLGRVKWQTFHGIDLEQEILNYRALFAIEVSK